MRTHGLIGGPDRLLKRPLSVTVIAIVLIATGIGSLAFHLTGFSSQHPLQYDALWIVLLGLAAIVSGVCLVDARNWARWLALAWIACHVILSFFHSLFQLGVHMLICAAFAYFLFRPRTNEYFRGVTGNR